MEIFKPKIPNFPPVPTEELPSYIEPSQQNPSAVQARNHRNRPSTESMPKLRKVRRNLPTQSLRESIKDARDLTILSLGSGSAYLYVGYIKDIHPWSSEVEGAMGILAYACAAAAGYHWRNLIKKLPQKTKA